MGFEYFAVKVFWLSRFCFIKIILQNVRFIYILEKN